MNMIPNTILDSLSKYISIASVCLTFMKPAIIPSAMLPATAQGSGNGNRQNAELQQFLCPSKCERRFSFQFVFEIAFRKFCEYRFTRTDDQPARERCGNAFDVVAVFLVESVRAV